jgi:ankyrin repeat protein
VVLSEELMKNAINAKDGSGKTPLILAAWQGDLKAVKKLLKSGAEVNTALMFAAYYGHAEIEAYLLSRGADKTGQ